MKIRIAELFFIMLSVCKIIYAHPQADSTNLLPDISTLSKPKEISINSNFQLSPIYYAEQTIYTWVNCPIGFNYNGNNQYPIKKQTTFVYYRNNEKVGIKTMPPEDMDSDCNKEETQEISCPIGYQGYIKQKRLISTSDNSYEYGAWSTLENTCVPIPTLQCNWNSAYRNPNINIGQTYDINNPVYAIYGTVSNNPFGSNFLPSIYDYHAIDLFTPAATNDPGLYWVESLDSSSLNAHQWKWALIGTAQKSGTYKGFYYASCGSPIGDNTYYQYTVN